VHGGQAACSGRSRFVSWPPVDLRKQSQCCGGCCEQEHERERDMKLPPCILRIAGPDKTGL